MRYRAEAKHGIIRTAEALHLPARQTPRLGGAIKKPTIRKCRPERQAVAA